MMLMAPTSTFLPLHLSKKKHLPTFIAIHSNGHDSPRVQLIDNRRRRWTPHKDPTRISSSNENPTVLVDRESISPPSSTVVRKFYDGINGHDLASVEGLIAENCVYEDLIFPQPFVGRKAIIQFFKKFIDSISTDLQFVIDDISDRDTTAVGVTWHLGPSETTDQKNESRMEGKGFSF